MRFMGAFVVVDGIYEPVQMLAGLLVQETPPAADETVVHAGVVVGTPGHRIGRAPAGGILGLSLLGQGGHLLSGIALWCGMV